MCPVGNGELPRLNKSQVNAQRCGWGDSLEAKHKTGWTMHTGGGGRRQQLGFEETWNTERTDKETWKHGKNPGLWGLKIRASASPPTTTPLGNESLYQATAFSSVKQEWQSALNDAVRGSKVQGHSMQMTRSPVSLSEEERTHAKMCWIDTSLGKREEEYSKVWNLQNGTFTHPTPSLATIHEIHQNYFLEFYFYFFAFWITFRNGYIVEFTF